MSKFFHRFFLVCHDEDGGHEEDDPDCVLGVELCVLKVNLKNKVQNDLKAAKHICLAWTDPPEIK